MSARLGMEPRATSLVRLAVGVMLLCGLAGCPSSPDKISDLPELPTDLALDLDLARTAPVLMTKAPPAIKAPAPDTKGGVILAGVDKACTAKWDGYVIYPITVCYPPYNLEQLEVLSAQKSFAALGFGPKADKAPAPKYYKLSSHPKLKRSAPWFCSVRGGPWYAHVEGQQLCGANPNIRSFKAEILGAPEAVVVTWAGAITDVPAPLLLVGITESGEECTCCSGVMCPDKTCKPKIEFCSVMPPALK